MHVNELCYAKFTEPTNTFFQHFLLGMAFTSINFSRRLKTSSSKSTPEGALNQAVPWLWCSVLLSEGMFSPKGQDGLGTMNRARLLAGFASLLGTLD